MYSHVDAMQYAKYIRICLRFGFCINFSDTSQVQIAHRRSNPYIIYNNMAYFVLSLKLTLSIRLDYLNSFNGKCGSHRMSEKDNRNIYSVYSNMDSLFLFMPLA